MLACTNMNRRTSLLGWVLAVLIALAIGQRWLPAELSSIRRERSDGGGRPDAVSRPRNGRRSTPPWRSLKAGGPFPYGKDGSEFSNREGRLPQQGPGYYREYTVETAGSPDRGARRIVSGRAGEIYYTRDHYQTFIRLN